MKARARNNPVVILALIAGLVVSIAAGFNVVLDTSLVETFLINGILIVTAFLQRRKVRPVPEHEVGS
jgi:hypothetical protein